MMPGKLLPPLFPAWLQLYIQGNIITLLSIPPSEMNCIVYISLVKMILHKNNIVWNCQTILSPQLCKIEKKMELNEILFKK